MINLSAAEMAELAEYTRKWQTEPHMTAKRTELERLAARRAGALQPAREAFDEAMRHVPAEHAEPINNYIRALQS